MRDHVHQVVQWTKKVGVKQTAKHKLCSEKNMSEFVFPLFSLRVLHLTGRMNEHDLHVIRSHTEYGKSPLKSSWH